MRENFKPVPADYEKRISPELKSIMDTPGYLSDNMSQFKAQYAAMGATPNHTRYGWVPKQRRGA